MKLKLLFATLIAATNLAFGAEVTTVNTLEELLPLLKKDNVNVKLAAGTYVVTPQDTKKGKFPEQSEVVEGRKANCLFLISGNGSTYDFTDTTIEVFTKCFGAFPVAGELHELHIIGSDNMVKNMKLVDVGSEQDFPPHGCVNVVMDGARNTIEGLDLKSVGSQPYGYGEIYGKGKNKKMGLKKHSAFLIRGEYNTARNCKVVHHAFGHFIFMQSALSPTVEGCYVEGKMGTTDDILKEAGTGSAADKIDFQTIYGYKTPKGYTLAWGEDGIRTYNRGATMVDGKRLMRGTTDVTVRDCVVKHARGGVALTLSSGKKIVENVTLIGCQGGFNVGSGGQIINCKADVAFGPALSIHYEKDSNITADITIIPYDGEKYAGNGSKQVAHLVGTNHNITLRKGEGLKPDAELEITIGGDRRTIGELAEDENYKASNIKLINETEFIVKIDDNASNTTVKTGGKVEDLGANSSINKL